MKEETEKPAITGIPQILRDSFETINVFKPPKHPIVKKQSPAAEYLQTASEEVDDLKETKEDIIKQTESLVELKETIKEAVEGNEE